MKIVKEIRLRVYTLKRLKSVGLAEFRFLNTICIVKCMLHDGNEDINIQ